MSVCYKCEEDIDYGYCSECADKHFYKRIEELENNIEKLEIDIITLALRLIGDDENTFSPETAAVMDNWRSTCIAIIQGKCQMPTLTNIATVTTP